jgi:hypothetical protein
MHIKQSGRNMTSHLVWILYSCYTQFKYLMIVLVYLPL